MRGAVGGQRLGAGGPPLPLLRRNPLPASPPPGRAASPRAPSLPTPRMRSLRPALFPSRCKEEPPPQDPSTPRSGPRRPSLSSRRWRFVAKGPDDFGTGSPSDRGLLLRGPEEGALPHIPHRAPRRTPKKGQEAPGKEAPLFPKLAQAQRAGKAFLQDVEAQPTGHPLALCPNLEEDVPAELLLKVLEVLDPDRKLEDTWASCQRTKKLLKEPTKLFKKCPTQVYLGPPKKTSVPHPGQWLYKEKKTNETDLVHENGSPLHKNVRQVVRDFCHWATDFGCLNIDEEFILKQFNIDYQSKTSCDVFRTMRLNQVPLELKKSVGLNKLQEPEIFHKIHCERKLQNPYKPKWVKMRYGAWYLNPKLWKKQRADEPLVDPKISQKAQDENFKKELQEQLCEELFADLHGTAAFKDFVLSRGYPMPSFLEKMTIRKDCKMCNKTPIK